MRNLIFSVVEHFYSKATEDILIGYHFYKFKDPTILQHHLERITSFWELQLTGKTSVPLDEGFKLLYTHFELRLKRGELGRWIILFHQTLDELENEISHPNIPGLVKLWKERIHLFEQKFLSAEAMFLN
jgi:truncated hemoglobin YjbI